MVKQAYDKSGVGEVLTGYGHHTINNRQLGNLAVLQSCQPVGGFGTLRHRVGACPDSHWREVIIWQADVCWG